MIFNCRKDGWSTCRQYLTFKRNGGKKITYDWKRRHGTSSASMPVLLRLKMIRSSVQCLRRSWFSPSPPPGRYIGRWVNGRGLMHYHACTLTKSRQESNRYISRLSRLLWHTSGTLGRRALDTRQSWTSSSPGETKTKKKKTLQNADTRYRARSVTSCRTGPNLTYLVVPQDETHKT